MLRSLAMIVLLLAIGAFHEASLATAMQPDPQSPEKNSGQGLGQLVIQDSQSGAALRLNVARYHVNVVLQPPVALVQIDQSFYNPYGQQQEGTFVFNLPRGASVSRFAMYVTPDELIEGELIERQRAAQVYDTIVSGRRDPAILEQIGDNLFRMRVFPVFARDTKRILLDYTIPLESDAGLLDSDQGTYQFQLPLLSDLKPIWDFRVHGTVRGQVDPETVRCPTHEQMDVQDRPTAAWPWICGSGCSSQNGTWSWSFPSPNWQSSTFVTIRPNRCP